VTAGQISQLLAEIVTAEDYAAIVDLLIRDANIIAELPPRERERANERIADAVRERRQLDKMTGRLRRRSPAPVLRFSRPGAPRTPGRKFATCA
jgi:hypothetical protein